MVRRRILGFAIGKMLRQDGWAEKYNPKNQFHVNQYDYLSCKEYLAALKEKWQEYEDPECEFEGYVDVSKYSNFEDYAYDVDVYRTRLEWRDEMDFDCEFDVNQRIIAENAQFTGIAAGQGVGFTTGLLHLRKGLGMRETPIRPHSWHCRMQSDYQYD